MSDSLPVQIRKALIHVNDLLRSQAVQNKTPGEVANELDWVWGPLTELEREWPKLQDPDPLKLIRQSMRVRNEVAAANWVMQLATLLHEAVAIAQREYQLRVVFSYHDGYESPGVEVHKTVFLCGYTPNPPLPEDEDEEPHV